MASFGTPGHAARVAGPDRAHGDGLPANLDALPPTAAGPAAAAPSLTARQLAVLSTSQRPADAYVAYKLLANCAQERAQREARDGAAGFQGRVGRVEGDDCAGVDPAQVERRVDWLAVAAAANLPGAAADLLSQGPAGQPREVVWNDPRYAGWRQRTLATVEQAAAGGDRDALAALARLYADGSLPDDGSQALKYQVAWIDASAAASYAQPAQRARYVDMALGSIERLGDALPPADRAAAIAAGHALGAACCGA